MKHPEKADERSTGRLMEQGAKQLPAHSTSTPAGQGSRKGGAICESSPTLVFVEEGQGVLNS